MEKEEEGGRGREGRNAKGRRKCQGKKHVGF